MEFSKSFRIPKAPHKKITCWSISKEIVREDDVGPIIMVAPAIGITVTLTYPGDVQVDVRF